MRKPGEEDASEPNPSSDEADLPSETLHERELPSRDSIVSQTRFISPKGRVYTIIKTDQTDLYDEPAEESSEAPDEEGGNEMGRFPILCG